MEAGGYAEACREPPQVVLEEAGPGDLEPASDGVSPALANASISMPKFLSGTSRPALMTLTGAPGGAALGSRRAAVAAARNGSMSAAWSATAIRSSGIPNVRSRARAAELTAMSPSACFPSRR